MFQEGINLQFSTIHRPLLKSLQGYPLHIALLAEFLAILDSFHLLITQAISYHIAGIF